MGFVCEVRMTLWNSFEAHFVPKMLHKHEIKTFVRGQKSPFQCMLSMA